MSEHHGPPELFLERLEEEARPFVEQVERGPFVQGVLDGTLPLDAIRFTHANQYHVLLNDMANLNLFVARARDEDEILVFHAIAAEKENLLEPLYHLTDALDLERAELAASEPCSGCLVRTYYFSRLAQYGTPGEIAAAILLSARVWSAGATSEARGLREHYSLGNAVPGSDAVDTDVLDRSPADTPGFREGALKSIARDLAVAGGEKRISLAGRWAMEYEAMVWDACYEQGVRQGGGSA